MNTEELIVKTKEIEEKQDKILKEKLHKTGRLVFEIYKLSARLSEALPHVFNLELFQNRSARISFKNSDFSYSVYASYEKTLELVYRGKYKFTYREINLDGAETGAWQIFLSDVDYKTHAVDIYSATYNLLWWLKNYNTQSDLRYKDMIEDLEK